MFVAHFMLNDQEEINVFEVKVAKETWGTFYIDEEDSRNLLFGRKLVRKGTMDKPFAVDVKKSKWYKDFLKVHKHSVRRYMEYFFGATKEEAISNLLIREQFYCSTLNNIPDLYEEQKQRMVKLQRKYLAA